MAILEEIRNRGVIIAIVIGVALFAFIATDFLTSGKSALDNSQNNIAKVWENSLPIRDFQNDVNNMIEIYANMSRTSVTSEMTKAIQDQVWEQTIRKLVLKKSYNNLGIIVSTPEFSQIALGNNTLHPIITQQYGDIDRQKLVQFLNQRNPNTIEGRYWLYFVEQPIIEQMKFVKYLTLVKKGLAENNAQIDQTYNDRKKNIDFNYVLNRYTTLPDSIIKVSESEIEEYYENRINQYKQEETRDIEYVTFEINPSKLDFEKAKDAINKVQPEFKEIKAYKEIIEFVNYKSDIPYSYANRTPNQIPDSLKYFARSGNLGDLYGPYFEDDTYKLTKLSAINYLPDSVNVSHILIQPNQTYNTIEQLRILADSLKKSINNGVSFAELAQTNSQDKRSAQQGGDLGWFPEETMDRSFNDSCFFKSTGDVFTVETDFGIHIVKINAQSPDVKKVQLATIEIKVMPSTKTYETIYANANSFLNTVEEKHDFDKAIKIQNLTKKTASDIFPNDPNISELGDSRKLIKWAYDKEEGEISKIIEIENNYVVTKLINVKTKGYTDIKNVENQIRAEIIKNNKADKIIENINNQIEKSENLTSLGKKINAPIENVTNVNILSNYVPTLGNEPFVISTALHSDLNKMSKPIKGNIGIYLIQVSNLTELETQNRESIKKEQIQRNNYFLDNPNFNLLYKTLREAADVIDNRIKFY